MDENEVLFDFDWLKDIAEKIDAKGKEDRHNRLTASAREFASISKMLYDIFTEAGFSDDQAFEILMHFVEMGE